MALFKKFKPRRRKVTQSSPLPVRHTTSNTSFPFGLTLFLVVFALMLGVYLGCHLMVASVYRDCATKGEWAWTSALLIPTKPITCSVDPSTRQQIGK